MANHGFWQAPEIIPSIVYSDLSQAIEWLERVFGFRERVEAAAQAIGRELRMKPV